MSSKTASARPGHDRASLYDEITGKIIAELEAGRVPWVQPWGTAAAKAPLAMPKNAATGRQYSGINVLILWGAVIEHGFPAQSWLTFRQALSLGGNVRKGEHGTTVVYADRFVPDDEKRRARETGEEAAAIPFLKRFTVFNAAQCENLPGRGCGRRATAAAGPDRAQGRGADPGDRRRLPHRRQPRLLRAGPGLRAWSRRRRPISSRSTGTARPCTSWGTPAAIRPVSAAISAARSARKKYAFEELVAEMNAAFCCASLGIVPTVRHADYIGSWLEVLREDNRAVVRAASQASKAADWILGFLDPDGGAPSAVAQQAA